MLLSLNAFYRYTLKGLKEKSNGWKKQEERHSLNEVG